MQDDKIKSKTLENTICDSVKNLVLPLHANASLFTNIPPQST